MNLQKKLIKQIDYLGKIVKVRGMKTKEIICHTFIVDDYYYELNKIEKEYVRRKLITYKKQINKVLRILEIDTHSRQAVIQFNTNSSKPNCVLSIQFLIRGNQLIVLVTSRSLDVKNKLYTDIEIAKKIAISICDKFNITINCMVFNVASLHYYKKW